MGVGILGNDEDDATNDLGPRKQVHWESLKEGKNNMKEGKWQGVQRCPLCQGVGLSGIWCHVAWAFHMRKKCMLTIKTSHSTLSTSSCNHQRCAKNSHFPHTVPLTSGWFAIHMLLIRICDHITAADHYCCCPVFDLQFICCISGYMWPHYPKTHVGARRLQSRSPFSQQDMPKQDIQWNICLSKTSNETWQSKQ